MLNPLPRANPPRQLPRGLPARIPWTTHPLPPPADPLADTRLQTFSARVPQPPEPGRFDVEEVAVESEALLIDVRLPESSYVDLFVEAPSVGRTWVLSAQAQAYAAALTITFLALLLAAAAPEVPRPLLDQLAE